MERQSRADLAMTLATLLLGASLVFSGVQLLRLHEGTVGTSLHFGLAEFLGIAAAGVGVGLLGWWLFALVCACLSAWLQARGSIRVAGLCANFSPAFMRRLVAAVLGLNLLAAPLAHAVDTPAVDPQWRPETVATAPAAVTPSPVVTSLPEATPSPQATVEPVIPRWVPRTAQTDPGPLLRPGLRPNAGPEENNATTENPTSDPPIERPVEVVVQRGDSLWSIVATALGPYSTELDVAREWPAWYQNNRATIGPDPHFILPGQVLQAPWAS